MVIAASTHSGNTTDREHDYAEHQRYRQQGECRPHGKLDGELRGADRRRKRVTGSRREIPTANDRRGRAGWTHRDGHRRQRNLICDLRTSPLSPVDFRPDLAETVTDGNEPFGFPTALTHLGEQCTQFTFVGTQVHQFGVKVPQFGRDIDLVKVACRHGTGERIEGGDEIIKVFGRDTDRDRASNRAVLIARQPGRSDMPADSRSLCLYRGNSTCTLIDLKFEIGGADHKPTGPGITGRRTRIVGVRFAVERRCFRPGGSTLFTCRVGVVARTCGEPDQKNECGGGKPETAVHRVIVSSRTPSPYTYVCANDLSLWGDELAPVGLRCCFLPFLHLTSLACEPRVAYCPVGWGGRVNMDALLVCADLDRSFGDLKAVQSVSFTVAEGETYGLLGPNGAGKTTTISMVAGLLKPDRGEVVVAGQRMGLRGSAAKASVGLVPQELAIYPDLTGRENLDFFARLYGLDPAERPKRVDAVLEVIGLTDRAKDRCGEYSGGMKRRLNIGIGMLHGPKLLILDEPTVGVDPQSRNAILESIEALGSGGLAVVYTTHYMEEAERLCDRIGIMDQGRLVAEGTRRELVRSVGEQGVVRLKVSGDLAQARAACSSLEGIGSTDTEDDVLICLLDDAASRLPSLLATVTDVGVDVVGVEVREPDLEDVFLHVTGRALRD